jgi:hypothetical protein
MQIPGEILRTSYNAPEPHDSPRTQFSDAIAMKFRDGCYQWRR